MLTTYLVLITLCTLDDQSRNSGITHKISSTFGGSPPLKEVRAKSVVWRSFFYFLSSRSRINLIARYCNRCRKGTAEVLINFDDLYPSDALSSDKTEVDNAKGPFGNIQVCGNEVPRGYWVGVYLSVVFMLMRNWPVSLICHGWPL